MVNQYARGRQFEYAVRDELSDLGYYVIRSAGSKGVADLVALGEGEVILLQLKITNPRLPPAERLALMGLALRVPALPLVAYKEKLPCNRVKISYRELTGPGPKDWEPWYPPALGVYGA